MADMRNGGCTVCKTRYDNRFRSIAFRIKPRVTFCTRNAVPKLQATVVPRIT